MSLTTLPPFLLSGNPIGQSYGSCKQNKGKLHPKSDRPLKKRATLSTVNRNSEESSEGLVSNTFSICSTSNSNFFKSSNIEIKTKQDLAKFKQTWKRGLSRTSRQPVRLRVYEEALYNEVHAFFGTKDEDEIERGSSGRVLNAGSEKEHVMKRSSPRKFPLSSRNNLALIDTSENEFAFYEDIQRREQEIN
jgi:hypothetical protein